MKTGHIIKPDRVDPTGLLFIVHYCHGDEEQNVEQRRGGGIAVIISAIVFVNVIVVVGYILGRVMRDAPYSDSF